MTAIKNIKNIVREIAFNCYWLWINSSNDNKVNYLRKKGCKIGNGNEIVGKMSRMGIGSEPYLITIGDNNLISDNVYFHTHDGGVKVLNALKFFPDGNYDKIGKIRVGNNCFIGSGVRIMGEAVRKP